MRPALPHRRPNVTRAVEWNGHAFTVTIGAIVEALRAEVRE
jgi:hypothetical protein